MSLYHKIAYFPQNKISTLLRTLVFSDKDILSRHSELLHSCMISLLMLTRGNAVSSNIRLNVIASTNSQSYSNRVDVLYGKSDNWLPFST